MSIKKLKLIDISIKFYHNYYQLKLNINFFKTAPYLYKAISKYIVQKITLEYYYNKIFSNKQIYKQQKILYKETVKLKWIKAVLKQI